jgi:AcrR family transcriptional regulator
VAEVAEVAEVSRATAYRYFPTREALLVEIKMFAPDGPMDVFDRVASESDDPVERVGILARRVAEWAVDNEAALRTLLRLSLDPQTGVRRPGHRVRWIAEVLEPLQGKVDEATLERLSAALTLLFGIDPVISLTDFGGLGSAQVVEVIEWVARTLVRCVVQGVNCVPDQVPVSGA